MNIEIKKLKFNRKPNGTMWTAKTPFGEFILVNTNQPGDRKYYWSFDGSTKHCGYHKTQKEAVDCANVWFADKVKQCIDY